MRSGGHLSPSTPLRSDLCLPIRCFCAAVRLKPLTAGRLALGKSLWIEGVREISACDLHHVTEASFTYDPARCIAQTAPIGNGRQTPPSHAVGHIELNSRET